MLFIGKLSGFVGFLMVLSLFACQEPNRFSNGKIQQLMTFQDERNGEQLLRFLNDEDAGIRAQAALAFAYIQEDSITGILIKKAATDLDSKVRKNLFYSLGQIKSELPTNKFVHLFDKENVDEVKNEIIIAAGKCSDMEWLKNNAGLLIKNYPAAYSEALFYASRSKKLGQDFLPFLISLLNEKEEARFFAASAIVRSSLILAASEIEIIQQLINEAGNISVSIPLLQSLSGGGIRAFPFLNEAFSKYSGDENYLLRLAVLKAIKSFPADNAAVIIQKALSDDNFHVREAAAEWCLEKGNILPQKFLLNQSRKEKYPRIKFYLVEAALKRASAKTADSLSAAVKELYQNEKDAYIQGYQLKALAQNFRNFAFIEEETFSTASILVREAGFEALLKIRADERYPLYVQQWNKTPASLSLEKHFASLIKNAVETHDVSMISLAAIVMRDTTLPGFISGNQPVPFADINFLRTELDRLKLPRDIEAFGELLQTIRYYEGKPISGSLKPDYNNPLNWDLIEMIPDDQQIEIETSEGTITIELWVNAAPGTVAQFLKLIKDDFYEDKRIHRVVPGFVVQDGCPRGDGYGSTMETIRTESSKKFEEGVLGMASSGNDTESCQWFITHTGTPHLNGRYTAFGKVVKGMEVVHKLAVGSEVHGMRILEN